MRQDTTEAAVKHGLGCFHGWVGIHRRVILLILPRRQIVYRIDNEIGMPMRCIQDMAPQRFASSAKSLRHLG